MRPTLALMGHGLDAIVQRDVDAMPPVTTNAMRLARYRRAVTDRPDRWHDLRVEFGTHYQRAWRAGARPDLRPLPREALTTWRAARALASALTHLPHRMHKDRPCSSAT